MAFIVIIDHRCNRGGVSVIDDEEEEPVIFNTKQEAREEIKTQFMAKSFPCIIVDLDKQQVVE